MSINIEKHKVGSQQPCFIVAEIGINHNGDVELAKKLVKVAHESGCNAVKFQKRTIELCYTEAELSTPRETPFGTTNGDLKRKLEFGKKEYDEIDAYCRELGILWTASCWDEPSLEFIMKYDPPFLKIPSARVRDEDKLLKLHRQTGKPIMMATGACTLDHIDHAVSVFDPGNLIIMHCVLNYPASDEELNLKMIQTLQDRYPGVSIGYSGHEKGVDTTVDAVVLGACIVERHITLDRTMFGSDQSASLEPHGLEMLVRNIRKWETASGSGSKSVSPAEEKNFQKLRRK